MREKNNNQNNQINEVRQREGEREKTLETSVESWCHPLDFSMVTDANNDLLACENQTYTWDSLLQSTPLLGGCRVEQRE